MGLRVIGLTNGLRSLLAGMLSADHGWIAQALAGSFNATRISGTEEAERHYRFAAFGSWVGIADEINHQADGDIAASNLLSR